MAGGHAFVQGKAECAGFLREAAGERGFPGAEKAMEKVNDGHASKTRWSAGDAGRTTFRGFKQ